MVQLYGASAVVGTAPAQLPQSQFIDEFSGDDTQCPFPNMTG